MVTSAYSLKPLPCVFLSFISDNYGECAGGGGKGDF
ncbi:antiterminator [Escherichia coli]|nr:antiterminator [Escherichia coli]QED72317.1 antiterminator [Escherichia coli]QEO90887.1 antiterminator [Escherichia coli]